MGDVACSSSGGNEGGDQPPGEGSSGDIDALARMLSQQAQVLRSSMSEDELQGFISGEDEDEGDEQQGSEYTPVAPDALVVQPAEPPPTGPPPQLVGCMCVCVCVCVFSLPQALTLACFSLSININETCSVSNSVLFLFPRRHKLWSA